MHQPAIILLSECSLLSQGGVYNLAAAATSQVSITLPITIDSQKLKLPIINVDNAADNMIGTSTITNSSIVIKKGVNDNALRTGRWGLVCIS